MSRDLIHISAAEAASDLRTVLDRVSAGAEVVIEQDSRPVTVVRALEAPHSRMLSESIALAKAHAKALGYEPTMDAEFAADLEQIVESHRTPLSPPASD